MPKPPLSPSTPPESGPRPLEHASATADEGFNEVFGPDSPTAAVLPSGDATAGASRNELDCRDTLEEEAREEAGKKGEKAVAPEHPCPYSAFSSREKALIVVLVSTAAIFSPLSANIYVPALPLLSEQFNVPTESINLTITLYLVFQALSPAWWGSLADAMGRRPIYLTTLTLYVLACASLAVIPTSAFWPLLVLRMVQAIGGASVIALGSGVVGDIADRKERGSYMGYYGMGSMLGPTLGPTIGGLLAEGLGWRSIFWFLVIATMLCLVPLAFFLPETLRTIVADGSVPPPALNRRFIDFFGSQERKRVSPRADVPPTLSFHERWKSFRPLESYRLLFEPDLLFLLFYVALIYAEFYMVLTSTSTFLKSLYGFSEIKIGLFYLANGGGALVSSLVTGKILDWDYGRVLRSLPPNLPPKDYPLEKARLKQLPLYCLIFHICCIGFGWAMESRAHIAVVVILQFGIGWCGTAAMTVAQSTSVDLFPSKGASVTASALMIKKLNLLRCLLGAVATSIVEPMIKRINAGWTFVVMSLICVSFSWMPMLNLKRGPAWREGRRLRENEREKQQREKAAAAVASEMQEPAV